MNRAIQKQIKTKNIPQYLCTITAYDKTRWVHPQELDNIMNYLISNHKVVILFWCYENSGRYFQLHSHFICLYKGSYSHLTKQDTFRVHFSRIKNLTTAYDYITKESSEQALESNNYSKYYFNQDTQQWALLSMFSKIT